MDHSNLGCQTVGTVMNSIPIYLSIELMKGNVALLSEKEAKTQDKIYKNKSFYRNRKHYLTVSNGATYKMKLELCNLVFCNKIYCVNLLYVNKNNNHNIPVI